MLIHSFIFIIHYSSSLHYYDMLWKAMTARYAMRDYLLLCRAKDATRCGATFIYAMMMMKRYLPIKRCARCRDDIIMLICLLWHYFISLLSFHYHFAISLFTIIITSFIITIVIFILLNSSLLSFHHFHY